MTVKEWLDSIKGINKRLAQAERNYKKAVGYRDTEKIEPCKKIYEKAKADKRAAENIIESVEDRRLRMTLRLAYIEDLKWSVVAYIADTTIPTIKKRLKRATEELEPIFEDMAVKYDIDIPRR